MNKYIYILSMFWAMALIYNDFCMLWCTNSQQFWIRIWMVMFYSVKHTSTCFDRKQPTLLDSEPAARNVLFCLTKPTSHHVSWIRKCFQADARAQACTIAATVQKQTTCHRRNMQAMHMHYRHQQCPASSKDQEHNRSTTVSLGSTIMQPLS